MNTMRLCIGDPLNRWFQWYDAEEGSAEVWDSIREDAPDGLEEFIIVDQEYFNPVKPTYFGISKAADFAEFVAGLHNPEALLEYVGYIGSRSAAALCWEYEEERSYFVDDEERFKSVTRYDFDELEDKFNEAYRGSYRSEEVFAEEFYAEMGYLSEEGAKRLAPYVDWERVATALGTEFTIIDADEVHVFWTN